MRDWIGLPEILDPDTHHSFVYRITNLNTGLKYIGKKMLWSTIRKPPLKGKKRKRIVVKPSDYKTYHGSSETLKADILKNGTDHYEREVLEIASCKWEAAWLELMYQLKENVLFNDDYLNGIVHIRLTNVPNHLKEKYKNFKIDFKFDNPENRDTVQL